jgi:hypothetical protein
MVHMRVYVYIRLLKTFKKNAPYFTVITSQYSIPTNQKKKKKKNLIKGKKKKYK